MEEMREEGVLRVEDAMRPPTGPVLDAKETLDFALRNTDESPATILLVRLDPTAWSILTRPELQAMVEAGKGGLSLGAVLSGRKVPFLHPDLPLHSALRYVERWPLVPVVSRADFRKLKGTISQNDVLARYRESGEG
jgi:CBS domain-containing protein